MSEERNLRDTLPAVGCMPMLDCPDCYGQDFSPSTIFPCELVCNTCARMGHIRIYSVSYIEAYWRGHSKMRQQRDDLSAEMERCHKMIDAHYGEDPNTTSLDTLEDRLAQLLAEIKREAI